jgi:hypothetical protein
MVLEHEVPSSIAESPVKTHEGRGPPFVAPSKLPILQFQLLKVTAGEGSSEKTHQSKVKVVVVLIFRLIDKVEISDDEPLGVIRRFGRNSFREKSLFLGVVCRAIDCGELEGGTT